MLVNNKYIFENLPESLSVRFEEVYDFIYPRVKVTVNGKQKGDIIDDNSSQNDGYRYHDVFHYTFATLLDWSPCTRAMLKRKRKSNTEIDRIEDGARATITEEAIALMIFEEAKLNGFYKDQQNVSVTILNTIKNMTSNFEVKDRSVEDWEKAILISYKLFCSLLENRGGEILFDRTNKRIDYYQLAS